MHRGLMGSGHGRAFMAVGPDERRRKSSPSQMSGSCGPGCPRRPCLRQAPVPGAEAQRDGGSVITVKGLCSGASLHCPPMTWQNAAAAAKPYQAAIDDGPSGLAERGDVHVVALRVTGASVACDAWRAYGLPPFERGVEALSGLGLGTSRTSAACISGVEPSAEQSLVPKPEDQLQGRGIFASYPSASAAPS